MARSRVRKQSRSDTYLYVNFSVFYRYSHSLSLVVACEHMLRFRPVQCEKHAKKEEALQKIRDGSKFDEVAREFSEDKAKTGGNLGSKTRGDLDPAFAAVAFELEASTTGNPKIGEVKTEHGYHIIMVESRK